MEMKLSMEDKSVDLYLRVPTYWDAIKKQWIGCVKTPNSNKLITAQGKNSFDLQNDFNINLHKYMCDENFSSEIFSMFKPLEYWERKE
jgi:hypothetical protein